MQFCLNIKLRPFGPRYPSSKQYALLRPPLASGGIVAPALLATVQSPNDRHPTPRSSSRVARKDRCTALRTHGVYAVSRSASLAISAYRRREDRTIACPNRCQPVACNAPPTHSAFPHVCVQVTRKTSEGSHRAGNLSVRHHVPYIANQDRPAAIKLLGQRGRHPPKPTLCI